MSRFITVNLLHGGETDINLELVTSFLQAKTFTRVNFGESHGVSHALDVREPLAEIRALLAGAERGAVAVRS